MNIEYLAHHKEVIPILARWLYEEWAYLHPERTYADVEHLISQRAQMEKIPIALIAFDGEDLLGTVSLKVHDMDTRLDLTPWLAGLYVSAQRRHKGIGTALVSAIEREARKFNVKSCIYTHRNLSHSIQNVAGKLKKERNTMIARSRLWRRKSFSNNRMHSGSKKRRSSLPHFLLPVMRSVRCFMPNLTSKQKASALGYLALLFFALSGHWLTHRLGVVAPIWLPTVLALGCLLAMLHVFVRTDVVRPWVFAAFAGFMAGLLLLPILGYT